jgi:hypothetical protein
MEASPKSVKLPSRGGRWLAVIAAIICVGSEAGYFATGSLVQGLRLAPVFAFVIAVFWLAFWAPRIVIQASGITIVNPFRTFVLTWASVLSVETRWVLTVVTANRRIAVWAAPRQRRGVTGIEVRRDSYGLPNYAAEQQFERQSAAVSAGDVAERLISKHLSERSEGNGADAGEVAVRTSLHAFAIALLVVLLAASVIAFAIH